MIIRPASSSDHPAIWSILEPVIRAGETYALDRDMTRKAALSYWCADDRRTFVAESGTGLAGTYYLRANQRGGGAHVANAGFVTAESARGKGIARLMGMHALGEARAEGYRAMQFNFVVEANRHAVELWESLGFSIVGRLPGAFEHPRLGSVDALVMYRDL